MISGIEGKAVYLSAPMTGMPDFNRAALEAAERECWLSGVIGVYNPKSLIGMGLTHEQCMATDLRAFFDMGDLADVVLVQLPGWRKSEGARLEHAVAVACGIETKEVNIDA